MKLFISFVDFWVPLNYNFGLRTFPVIAAQIVANGGKMGGIEERWDDPSKPAVISDQVRERGLKMIARRVKVIAGYIGAISFLVTYINTHFLLSFCGWIVKGLVSTSKIYTTTRLTLKWEINFRHDHLQKLQTQYNSSVHKKHNPLIQ